MMYQPISSSCRSAGSILAIMFALLAACTPYTTRFEPEHLDWPTKPDQPRIHYVKSIFGEDDIGRVYSLKEKLFGKDYVDSLSRPYGVFARNGKLLVSDLNLKSVLVFDLQAKRMSYVSASRPLVSPSSLAMDTAGTVYATDAGTSSVTVFRENEYAKTIYESRGGKLVAIALNETLKRLYVVDRNKHLVHVLDLNGKSLFDFGGEGTANGKFNYPLNVTLDRSGNIYVLDNGNFRVQIFDADGKFTKTFGFAGDRPGNFANPKGIAVDSDGHIYVTDAAFNNFQIFNSDGQVLLAVGNLGPNPGQFHLPAGIAIDEQDRIYVADQLNRRVEVFQYLKVPESGDRPAR